MFHDSYKPKKWGNSNDFEPKVIHNFLSQEDLKEVWDSINTNKLIEPGSDFYAPYIYEKESRQQIELKISDRLLKYIENFASEFTGEDVIMTHNSYLSYKKSHSSSGYPQLFPHFDSDNYFTKLTMDYQLNSNISFPIVIDVNKELKSFDLKNNELLIFWGAGTIHWRKPTKFDEDDHCQVWTMHFAKKEDFEKLNLNAREVEERLKRSNYWDENTNFINHIKKYIDEMRLIKKKYKKEGMV